jgi:solute:Na+ symporter, SSS family
MPYIALQLVGIESVLTVMGIGSTSGNAFIRDLRLIIAFGVVAACTYLAGLRAPALIAFVKDILIYVTVIVAMLYIPWPSGHEFLGDRRNRSGGGNRHIRWPGRRPASAARPRSGVRLHA